MSEGARSAGWWPHSGLARDRGPAPVRPCPMRSPGFLLACHESGHHRQGLRSWGPGDLLEPGGDSLDGDFHLPWSGVHSKEAQWAAVSGVLEAAGGSVAPSCCPRRQGLGPSQQQGSRLLSPEGSVDWLDAPWPCCDLVPSRQGAAAGDRVGVTRGEGWHHGDGTEDGPGVSAIHATPSASVVAGRQGGFQGAWTDTLRTDTGTQPRGEPSAGQ